MVAVRCLRSAIHERINLTATHQRLQNTYVEGPKCEPEK